MSMAHAVEVRPPFLDHRIVEFAAALPVQYKMSGSRQKIVLKELMKDKLPPSVLRRAKNGLDIPIHEWFRGPLRSLLLDVLASGISEYGGLFHVEAIERHLRDHMERRANLGYHLWGLMILFLWMRKWRIQIEPVSALKQKAAERVLSLPSSSTIRQRRVSRLHHFSAVADGRRGRSERADSQKYACVRGLGHSAHRRTHLLRESPADVLDDGGIVIRYSECTTGQRVFPSRYLRSLFAF